MSANTHSSAVAYKLIIGGMVMTQFKNDGVI
jgi:hypothetical protein